MDGRVRVVETPDAFLEKEVERGSGMPLKRRRWRLAWFQTFSITVDMVGISGESDGMIEALVAEAFDVQGVVGDEAIGVDHAVRNDMVADDRHQRGLADVRDHLGIDLATALEDAEDWHFARRTTPSLAFAYATEGALVQLHRSTQHDGTSLILLGNPFSKSLEKQGGTVSVDAEQSPAMRAVVPATKCSTRRAWTSADRRLRRLGIGPS